MVSEEINELRRQSLAYDSPWSHARARHDSVTEQQQQTRYRRMVSKLRIHHREIPLQTSTITVAVQKSH